ncbi:MAG: DUF2793 domain-containing protein [Porticoccus sp.]|nr:DUF2793 domain-containing protein [Porticoccus sp.]
MATTPILGITEIAVGIVDQYLLINQAFEEIEASTNTAYLANLTSGNVTLTAADMADGVLFRLSGHTVARDLTLPALARLFALHNNGTGTVSVIVGATSLDILAGETGFYHTDGTTDGLISVSSGGGGGGAAAVSIISPDTATTHTTTVADNGGLLIFNSASDCVLTVPQTSTEALDAGFHVLALNQGGGTLSLALEGSDVVDEVKLWADASQAVTVLKEVAGSPNTWRLMGNAWQPGAVEDDALTAPPTTPAVGAVYIPLATATGTWATHEGDFAVHLGSDVYDFISPSTGQTVYEKTSALWIGHNGSAWVSV